MTIRLDLELTLAFPESTNTAAIEQQLIAAGWEDTVAGFMGVPTLVKVTVSVKEPQDAITETIVMQDYLDKNLPDGKILEVGGDCMEALIEDT